MNILCSLVPFSNPMNIYIYIYILNKLLYIRYPDICRNQRDQSGCKTTACLNDEECRLMSSNPLMVCIKGNCLENSFICTTDRDCKYFRSVSKF